MNIHKEKGTGAGFSPALMDDVTRAARLRDCCRKRAGVDRIED